MATGTVKWFNSTKGTASSSLTPPARTFLFTSRPSSRLACAVSTKARRSRTRVVPDKRSGKNSAANLRAD